MFSSCFNLTERGERKGKVGKKGPEKGTEKGAFLGGGKVRFFVFSIPGSIQRVCKMGPICLIISTAKNPLFPPFFPPPPGTLFQILLSHTPPSQSNNINFNNIIYYNSLLESNYFISDLRFYLTERGVRN